MIATDELIAQLCELGRVVTSGDLTYRNPVIIEPARYPRPNGPRSAQVKVWATNMVADVGVVRFSIRLKDASGRFTEEQVNAALARENRGHTFGSLKVSVTKSERGSVCRGEVHYAVPVTGDDFSWIPMVLSRLLKAWQDATIIVRSLAAANGRLPGFGRSTTVTARIHVASTPDEADESVSAESITELLKELDALVGMRAVKEAVRRLVATQEIARKRVDLGLRTTVPSPNLVFTGNPGTGKTTIARMIGRIYKSLGLLSSGHVIEVGRSDLVGGYVGQTALKTKEVCESALGGVLFIDEAYSLRGASANDYGHEAVETLLTFMETNRDKVAVVVAGYPDEMKAFIDMNPGLSSRFDQTIDFADYSNIELTAMLSRSFDSNDYIMFDSQFPVWQAMFANMPRGRGFGNAREVRRVFHEVLAEQAMYLTEQAAIRNEDLHHIAPHVLHKVSRRYLPDIDEVVETPELTLGYL